MAEREPDGLTEQQRHLVNEIIHAAADRPADERPGIARRLSAGDEAVYQQAVSLLRAMDDMDDGSFLEKPARVPPDQAAAGDMADLPTRSQFLHTESPGRRAHARHWSRGDTIGPYALKRKLGEGGFGEVWLAERRKPDMFVAIKVLKPGVADKQSKARFFAESQAMAYLDHPYIARVIDGGTLDDDDLPYVVMEFIEGVPLTKYCDSRGLSIEQRLELIARICEGVHHAHSRGLIHRDLKPGNILITEARHDPADLDARDKLLTVDRVDGKAVVPVPKIVDFGLAKATLPHLRLSDESLTRDFGKLMGTPEYMAPEQASHDPLSVDTRADIFALGVLTYELLTGVLPLTREELQERAIHELVGILQGTPRPEPSTKFSSLDDETARRMAASRDEMTPAALGRILRSRARHIVGKALRLEPHKRFSSSSAMADDIRAYLDGRDFQEAAAEPWWEKARRHVRRHKLPYAAAALVMLSLIGGIIGTTWGLQRAKVAEQEAQHRANEMETMAAFQESQLAGIDTEIMGIQIRDSLLSRRQEILEHTADHQSKIEVGIQDLEHALAGINFTSIAVESIEENILAKALPAIDEQFADQPQLQARLFQTVADTMRQLGLYDRSLNPHRQALEIRRRVLGDLHPDTIVSIRNLGWLYYHKTDYDNAMAYLREALDASRRVHGETHSETLTVIDYLGGLFHAIGRYDRAESYSRQALEGRRRALGNEHPDTLHSMNNMAIVLQTLGRLDEAEALHRETFDIRRRVLGDNHPNTLSSLHNLGSVLMAQARYDEAEPYVRQALERRRRILGDEHQFTFNSINNLGYWYLGQEDYINAKHWFTEALAGRRRTYGNDHIATLQSKNNLASLLVELGELEQARQLCTQVLERSRQLIDEYHPERLNVLTMLGEILRELRELEQAEQLGRKAVETAHDVLPDGHWYLSVHQSQYARTLAAMSRFDEAERYLLEAYKISISAFHTGHKRTIHIANHLTDLYDAWHAAEPGVGHDAKAAEWRAKLEDMSASHADTDSP